MKKIPDLGFWKLWNISFGFFGVQIAYALQSANISRIFSTLGSDPHSLSYFWILPPLAGIIVQPIIGALSDRTWTRFGRRIPYLFAGALVAVCVMCLLPNAGSFGMTVSAAMVFGLISLMFLDTSINMAMQPFKMMVGDMVNEKQKGLAYSIQSFLCNAGSLAGYLFPFIFAAIGISNIAPKGIIPDSVIYSFYIGALILILCVIYTSAKVKEFPPEEYAAYHGITHESKKEKTNMFKLLVKAPKAFWTVGLVQFFCWASLHVHVDLHQWNSCFECVRHTGHNNHDKRCFQSGTGYTIRTIPDSGRLGRDLICCPSHWFRYLGNDHPDDSEPQTCLRTQSGIGRHWIHLHFLYP